MVGLEQRLLHLDLLLGVERHGGEDASLVDRRGRVGHAPIVRARRSEHEAVNAEPLGVADRLGRRFRGRSHLEPLTPGRAGSGQLSCTSYTVPGARCAFETVGPDHFVFGTDSPPLFVLKREGVDLIRKMGLSPDDENKVYYANAKKLLKL